VSLHLSFLNQIARKYYRLMVVVLEQLPGLVFLQKLEAESGKKIADMFDMFVGVSAGALNALCFRC
jgi:hypothetical protein